MRPAFPGLAVLVIAALLLLGLGHVAGEATSVTRPGRLECGWAASVEAASDRCEPHSEATPREFWFSTAADDTIIVIVLEWEGSGTAGGRALNLSAATPWLNRTSDSAEGRSPLYLNLTSLPGEAVTFNVTVGPGSEWVTEATPYAQDFNVTLTFHARKPSDVASVASDEGVEGETAADGPWREGEKAPAPAAAAAPAPTRVAEEEWDAWRTPALVGGVSLILFVPARRLVWGLLIRLFSRIDKDELLEHPRRRALVDAVRPEAGMRHEELRRLLGLSNGVFEHHVQRLVAAGLLVRQRGPDGAVRYAMAGHAPAEPPRRSRLPASILDVVSREPGLSQSQVARRLGASLQLVNYHVRRLGRRGRLELVKDGRVVRCYPVPG